MGARVGAVRLYIGLALAALSGPALAAPALTVCSTADLAVVQAALRPAAGAAAPMCAAAEVAQIIGVLRRCNPAPAEAVVHLGAGRCLQQAGLRQEAIRQYEAYLASGDPSVSRARAAERRERVRIWLKELGQPDPGTAPLVVSSNLRGALVRHLEGYPDGLTLDAGDNRLMQPPGSRTLSLSLKGFERVDLPVDLLDDVEARVSVDWREHLSPRYAALRIRWDDFQRSGLTPAGYVEKKQKPLSVIGSLLLAAGGAGLIAVCAVNVNGACDADWQKGLAYSFGALFAIGGTVGALGSLFKPVEPLPPPGLGRPTSGAGPRPERVPYY